MCVCVVIAHGAVEGGMTEIRRKWSVLISCEVSLYGNVVSCVLTVGGKGKGGSHQAWGVGTGFALTEIDIT